MEYVDFELEISAGRGRTYPVAVLRSPAGEPRATLKLPFDQRGLQLRLLALENALLRSGATHTRRITSPDEAPVQALGEGLFGALLTGEVLSCYDQSQRAAREQRKGLRLKLRIQAPDLAALPWEFLYDPREDEFVCLSRRTPIVRYIESRQSMPPLSLRPPLRILGLVASPEGMPTLDVPTEQRRVEEALKELRAGGLVELVWLSGQTWTDLQNAMWRGPWHIFHFIGHGGFDADRDEGVLALADEAGGKRLLTATELGRLLGDHDPLRLAVLNACEGARGGRLDIFSSSAATLVRRGVPAVVAMQYEISDPAAIQFGNRFYAAVAHGMAADAALAEARIGMSVATRESAEWGTPVLFTNAPDMLLFDLAEVPAAVPPPTPATVDTTTRERLDTRWTQALSYFWTERWTEAAELLAAIVAEQADYRDATEKLAEARRQAELGQLYAGASRAYEGEAWTDAIDSLEKLIQLDAGYRDAAALLEEARRRQRLGDLYADARELHRAGAWRAALNVLERIRAMDAGFADTDGLEASVRESLAAEEQQRTLQALLARALHDMDEGAWPQAIHALEELSAQQPHYGQVDALLARAQQELAREQEAEQQKLAQEQEATRQDNARQQEAERREEEAERQRRSQAELEDSYADARQRFAARDWKGVVATFERMRVLAPPDPDGLLAAARRHLDEAEREVKIAGVYDEALRYRSAGNWARVAQLLESIEREQPGYRDVAARLDDVRSALVRAEQTSTSKADPAQPVAEAQPAVFPATSEAPAARAVVSTLVTPTGGSQPVAAPVSRRAGLDSRFWQSVALVAGAAGVGAFVGEFLSVWLIGDYFGVVTGALVGACLGLATAVALLRSVPRIRPSSVPIIVVAWTAAAILSSSVQTDVAATDIIVSAIVYGVFQGVGITVALRQSGAEVPTRRGAAIVLAWAAGRLVAALIDVVVIPSVFSWSDFAGALQLGLIGIMYAIEAALGAGMTFWFLRPRSESSSHLS